MRIVIDMQGAQTESKYRGIGRYTIAFAQAVCRNCLDHEIFLVLNGMFPETITPIRRMFDGILNQNNIRVWNAIGPVSELSGKEHSVQRVIAEDIRETFIKNLEPDIVHISSLFEGYIDDAVLTVNGIGSNTITSVILYDLIPLMNSDDYLKPNPIYADFYQKKLEYLKKSGCLLAISESSRKEGIECLGVNENTIFNISTAIDDIFSIKNISTDDSTQFLRLKAICKPFVLYTGGADKRKNLPRLIEAYSSLPQGVRNDFQLVLAGRMPESNVTELSLHVKKCGLEQSELIFTGYINDDELIKLYNLCHLFIFPSWHEGFGLPALEAMSCGAPTIGSNSSSIPEVIGCKNALFDPLDISSIYEKLYEGITSEKFRNELKQQAKIQIGKFSWNSTAQLAIEAWELSFKNKTSNSNKSCRSDYLKPIMTNSSIVDDNYLLKISSCIAQNEQNEIQRELLVDISELVKHDSETGVQRVVRSYLKWLLTNPPKGFVVRPVYASLNHSYKYATNFLQKFLNEAETSEPDEDVILRRGDIFFGLDLQHHIQLANEAFYFKAMQEGVTVKFLVYDLLPIELPEYFIDSEVSILHKNLMALIARTDGAICISKATAEAFDSWTELNNIPKNPYFKTSWLHIGGDIEGSIPSQGIPDNYERIIYELNKRSTFICVSTIEPRKAQEQVLNAVELMWQKNIDINMVFVGKRGWKVDTLIKRLNDHKELNKRLFWFEGISDEYLEMLYKNSDCLIAASINEGFGLPVIEAARHNISIVARDIPVYHEIAKDSAYYFSGNEKHLSDALVQWLKLYENGNQPNSADINWLSWEKSTEILKNNLLKNSYYPNQIFVDISELVEHDAKSGIQRVVRSILNQWLVNPPNGYRIEPIYATTNSGYRYARKFLTTFNSYYVGCKVPDDPIEFSTGDIFIGLDYQPQVVRAQHIFYQKLRHQGVKTYFVVYDLLNILMPQYFPEGSDINFTSWLNVVAESDGAFCISRSVENEFKQWLKNNYPDNVPMKTDWFHLGADVDQSCPTQGLPDNADHILAKLSIRPTFIMVGTLEPRKGHLDVLEAFEYLWEQQVDINLVIVGKNGWMVDNLVKRLHSHTELNTRLFWLDSISDEYLNNIYSKAACLIAASYGEGFGLPLIEAAQIGIPIIARDIPVFHEIAGDNIYYFSGKDSYSIVKSIKEWLVLFKERSYPKSDKVPWLTWEESSNKLSELLKLY
jgi:glycosyltransferase involved in cell wall biosynthesis